MASFTHARSNSLPSKSHPTAASVEDHLSRLRSADTASSSTTSICKNLASLADLHESLHDLIQLPSVQQELSNRSADEILDRSVRLLDVCSTTKDIMVHIKESVKELELALRRNRGGDSCIANDIDAYATSKKKVNKMIAKCIKNNSLTMLEESEAISFSILKSVLLYLSGNKANTSSWSLINKFVQSKQKQPGDVHDMKHLSTLEMTIQELEELLETVFRNLIKRRVSLLNILDH